MTNSSKNKGNNAERQLCKLFSDTFKSAFIRTANSGAFIGGKNNSRAMHLSQSQKLGMRGDIVPPDNMQRLVIESKHYKEFPYHNLLTNCEILNKWITQTLTTTETDTFWLICFKADRKPWCVCYSRASGILPKNYLIYREDYVITDLETFLHDHAGDIRKCSS